MFEDTREDIEVGTRERLEAVQVAKNGPDDFLTTRGEKVREKVQCNDCECRLSTRSNSIHNYLQFLIEVFSHTLLSSDETHDAYITVAYQHTVYIVLYNLNSSSFCNFKADNRIRPFMHQGMHFADAAHALRL